MKFLSGKKYHALLLIVSAMVFMFEIPGGNADCSVCGNNQRAPATIHNELKSHEEPLETLMDLFPDIDNLDLYHPWNHFDDWNPLVKRNIFNTLNRHNQMLAHITGLCNIMLHNKWDMPIERHRSVDEGYHSDSEHNQKEMASNIHTRAKEEAAVNESLRGRRCTTEKDSKGAQSQFCNECMKGETSKSKEGMTQWRRAAKAFQENREQSRVSSDTQSHHDFELDKQSEAHDRLRQAKKLQLLKQQRAQEDEMQRRKEELERQRRQTVKQEVDGARRVMEKRPSSRYSTQNHEKYEGMKQHNAATLTQYMENPKRVSFSINVPGYHPDNLDIQIKDAKLKIQGRQVCGCEENCVMREFEKSFDLPEGTDVKSLRAFLSGGTLSINGFQYGFPMKITDSDISVESFDQHLPPRNAHLHCQKNKPGLKLSKVDKRTGKPYVHEEYDESNNPSGEQFYGDDDVLIEVVDEYM